MLSVKQLDSGVACLDNYRTTRANLRALKTPEQKSAELRAAQDRAVELFTAALADTPAIELPADTEPSIETAEIIPAEIPPVYPEIVMARGMPSKTVVMTVAKYYGVPRQDLLGPRKTAPIAHARQVAMYLLRASYKRAWHEIGRRVNRDHSCAIHGYKKIAKLLETDEKLRDDIDVLRTKLADLLGPAREVV